jgi:hypothetical protein
MSFVPLPPKDQEEPTPDDHEAVLVEWFDEEPTIHRLMRW